jgi:phosphate starvation-inducible PhoH-like protein
LSQDTPHTRIATDIVEKVIVLDNIALVDFLGVDNKNIQELSAAFPQSKIISRGNEIRIKGTTAEIIRINDIINQLIEHYNRYGIVNQDNVKSYLNQDEDVVRPGKYDGVLVYGNRGILVKPRTANQQKLVESVYNNDIVFAIGPAGTGKTYVAVALAVRALKNKEVKKIIITRPAVEAGENLGFLPGDLKEKIDPYLRPIYDALEDMIPPEKLRFYQENHIIEIAPLAYMRGRTLHNAFILLDESQNTTPMQLKMFLTRMGPDSKMIITGDKSQIDLPPKQKSGLIDAIETLAKIEGISFVYLDAIDVMRHPLVKKIIKAYENVQNKQE